MKVSAPELSSTEVSESEPEPVAELSPEPESVIENLPDEPQEQTSSKTYNAEERQALAEEMLPPDVLEYLKEEFRAQFSSVRKLSDRKVY